MKEILATISQNLRKMKKQRQRGTSISRLLMVQSIELVGGIFGDPTTTNDVVGSDGKESSVRPRRRQRKVGVCELDGRQRVLLNQVLEDDFRRSFMIEYGLISD